MIEYGYNSIIIRNPDKSSKNFEKFHRRLSTWDKVRYKFTDSVYREFNDDIFVPYTIGLDTIKYYFRKEKTIFNPSLITRSRNISYNLIHSPRSDTQKIAIKFLSNMVEDQYNRSRFLSLNTGDGKTFVSISASSILGKVVLVIVDTVDLADQWKREFLKHTDLQEDDIYLLSGLESVKNAEKDFNNKKIYIAIHRTLQMMISDNPSSLSIMLNRLGIGTRIFDECHVEFGNICSINSFSNVEYTIYLTATPNRTKFMEDKLYQMVFKDVPFYSGKTLSKESKYHFVYLANMNTHPTKKQEIDARTKYGPSAPKWSDYILNEKYDIFYKTVLHLLNDRLKLYENNYKTVIILPKIDLINKLYDDLNNKEYGPVGKFIGSISKKEDRLKELDHKLIISNDKMFAKGLDDDDWDGDLEVIINFVPMSSHVKLEQMMGRLRRKENMKSVFIDVTDIGFNSAKNQLRSRKTFYNKKAKIILNAKTIIE